MNRPLMNRSWMNSPWMNRLGTKSPHTLQQQVNTRKIQTVDELQQCIIEEWECLDQHMIDNAVIQWCLRLCACKAAKGGHFEQSL